MSVKKLASDSKTASVDSAKGDRFKLSVHLAFSGGDPIAGRDGPTAVGAAPSETVG